MKYKAQGSECVWLLCNIRLITNIVLSIREHDKEQWENMTDGNVYFMLSFVDLAYVNEVWQQNSITSDKRQDLYKLIAV